MLGATDRIQQLLAAKGNEVETIEPDATVLDAAQHMHDRRVGSVVVVEDDRIVGILTERDVMGRVVVAGLNPGTTAVRDVMTSDLYTVDPNTTVAEAMYIATNRRCRHLPVIDGDQLVGLVSAGDLTAWLVKEQRIAIDDLELYITR